MRENNVPNTARVQYGAFLVKENGISGISGVNE